ncbi:hypothetical protein SAMN05421828_111114 [Acidiphilium rubrum]|uniref:Uncharacterized protein n=2 Tax=Acidocellaceae TaxID=3385905 RepID=A0A8G2CL33_ACIRU|nr:hypothetical protein SAMN05421828_111114 [Acidiphilium rubrum]
MATIETLMNDEPTVHQDAAFYAARRTMTWQRSTISPRLRLLLWSLRLYVVLMLAVVAIALARLLQ